MLGTQDKAAASAAAFVVQSITRRLLVQLLDMDHLAACVQSALHLDSLAFELRHLILVINVIGITGVRILKHILVTRFYDRTREALNR